MKSKIRKIIMLALALFIVFAAAMPVISYAESDVENNGSETAFLSEKGIKIGVDNGSTGAVPHWQDYIGKKIGVLTGTPLETVAEENFAGSGILYFNSYPDCVTALLAGEIDAYLCDEPNANMTHHEEPRIDYIHERLTQNDYAFAFRKDDTDSAALLSEFNAFLKEIKENGIYEEIEDIWFGTDESRKVVDTEDLTGENGTITIATTSTDMPWSYIKDNKNVGFDIDIVARFCKERGYALSIMDVDFAARIPALQSGKCDFTTDMNVTPERQEEVLFSDATADGGVVVVTLAENLASPGVLDGDESPSGGKGLLNGVKDSFNKTFIREDRYRLFLKGILTTIIITLLSVIFGTALGFLVYMLCRNEGKISNAIAAFSIWLIQGMPVVVLLMILYYIIFAKANISGTAVAVFAFTLVFGSGVFNMLKSGVGAIDKGQTEAALSLGYGDIHSFFRIILPQAVPHFLPAYKGEMVALLKATAIVGYIAVQDLTKMGDIVRGRTYEAFFPLIAVAVIYFILAGMLKFVIGRIEVLINPRRRKREDILKGVKPGSGYGYRPKKSAKEQGFGHTIEIKDLRKEFPSVTPIKDVSVTINDGDVVSVIGPSGTGKSTLIRCINLLETPTAGQIILKGEEITAKGYDVRKARRRMGMVFQSFNLFGHLTVIENMMLAPMDLLRKSKQDAYDTGMELLKRVGLSEKALSYPDELSGGQKQRVAIARTLAMDPEVILLDEPTSALDPMMVSEVQAVIRDLAGSGKTMMIVTHEMNFARAISNRVFYMDEGGIYEDGTPEEIFDHPKKENTRRFIKKLRVFEAMIDSRDYDFIGFGTQIDRYLLQNDVSGAMKYRIRLCIEELVQQILLPRYEDPDIGIKLEYSMQDGEALLIVEYGGVSFDIADTDNTLSLKLLKSSATDISHEYKADAKKPNCVAVRIGE